MDKTSLAYIQDKAKKGGILAAKIEYCENALNKFETDGIEFVRIQAGSHPIGFDTRHYLIEVIEKDSVDCYGEIALQVIKDLRDRYQAEFDAL